MNKSIFLVWLHSIWFTHKKLHKIFKELQNYEEIFKNINYKLLKEFNFNSKQIENIIKKYNKIDLW
jgi:hypothetical protein